MLLLFLCYHHQEKLSLDEQRSSPSVVRTFRGFRTRLSCSFTRGVPPIVVTLIKGGRTIGRTQNRNVDGALEMYVMSFGRYTCMATDLSGVTVRHSIEVKQARKWRFVTLGNHGNSKSSNQTSERQTANIHCTRPGIRSTKSTDGLASPFYIGILGVLLRIRALSFQGHSTSLITE